MTVNTKKIARRVLRFESYDDLLREAERLVAAPVLRSTGNWTLGQALAHLTGAMRMSLAQLRAMVERLRREPQRHPHPAFGKFTRDQWDQLNWRHAELHLSFHDVPE